MEHKCDICNKNFQTKESLQQHNFMKHGAENKEKKKINYKKYFIFIAIGLIIIFSILSILAYMKKPGQYDDFAKCLTEKGAIVYGNDYCSYTRQQLNFFGKSKKYLNYIKCIDNEALCDEKGVSTTPTWEINGQMYEQVQTFGTLATASGCEI